GLGDLEEAGRAELERFDTLDTLRADLVAVERDRLEADRQLAGGAGRTAELGLDVRVDRGVLVGRERAPEELLRVGLLRVVGPLVGIEALEDVLGGERVRDLHGLGAR